MYTDSGPDRFELPASAVTAKLVRALDSGVPNPRYYVTTATYIGGYLKRVLSSRMIDRIVSRI